MKALLVAKAEFEVLRSKATWELKTAVESKVTWKLKTMLELRTERESNVAKRQRLRCGTEVSIGVDVVRLQ